MKILIVSFDKNLIKQLKEVLKDYEVVDVKNGEEALNLATQHFDIVIYDAISGAISEEDINNMYEERFRDAKFIVLIDDLFPINERNLKPHKKLLMKRDNSVQEILDAIEKPLGESMELPPTMPSEFEIESTSLTEEGIQKIVQEAYPEEVKIPELESEHLSLEQLLPQEGTVISNKKVAIVSFDGTFIDSIVSFLPKDVEVYPVRSFRNLEDVLKDQDLVVLDAISGLAAKKRLMELSKDPIVSSKPFIIVIDELFSIEVEDIPLAKKYATYRADSPEKIAEKIMEILTSEETKTVVNEGIGPMQILEKVMQEKEEEEPLEKLLEGITTMESKEEALEVGESISPVDEIFGKKEESFPFIPTEEAPPYEEIKEIQLEEISLAEEREKDHPSQVVIPDEKIERAIYQAIKDIGPIDEIVRKALKEAIEESFQKTLREEIRKAIESIPLENMIREVTYQAIKERLRELIT
ncbi:hypothetical protein [Thermocrinis sp.]|uniref:hypothetical protein n=1 Tax=Thermocrinis sp. TaxID=2024383 RepID=UPI002FDDC5E8